MTDFVITYNRKRNAEVGVNELVCVVAEDKYVTFHTNNTVYTHIDTLKRILGTYPGLFTQISRDTIVKTSAIEGWSSDHLGNLYVRVKSTSTDLRVSVRRRKAIKEKHQKIPYQARLDV